jgi:chorismate dehydratase
MTRLRVSAISYLNTAPLLWNFEYGRQRESLREQFEIAYTIPSRCAEMLAEGSADIGIIPIAAYSTIAGLKILPDVAIASKGAVRSILLVSEHPLDRIRSVALDSSSRSSAALVRVLFAKHWDREVQFVQAEPQLEDMLAKHDAALLIGDPALRVDRFRYQTWDLAEEWKRFTGKPFVFAFWAARSGVADDDELSAAAEILSESRDEGLRHVSEIASKWAPNLRIPPELIKSYLRENIHYHLDSENIAGMELFFSLAAELDVLRRTPELSFARELEFRNSASKTRF